MMVAVLRGEECDEKVGISSVGMMAAKHLVLNRD